MMDLWDVKVEGNNVIVTHKDGSGVVVKQDCNERIADEILARMALDLLEQRKPSTKSQVLGKQEGVEITQTLDDFCIKS